MNPQPDLSPSLIPKKKQTVGYWLMLVILLVAGLTGALFSQYPVDELVFGTWCSDCEEECSGLYLVEKTTVLADTSEVFVSGMRQAGTYSFWGVPLGESSRNHLSSFSFAVPAPLLLKPDNAAAFFREHSCGIYVQFNIWGIQKELAWARESPPTGARAFSEELWAAEGMLLAETQRFPAYRMRSTNH